MSEPYGQHGRVLAGFFVVTLLAGSLIWAGATAGDLTESRYPDEVDVTPDRETYVGEQVVLGGRVVDTDPVVIATRASGYGRFTLVDADARLRSGDGPLERGDRVTAFGTLEDDSTLAVERVMTRESSETSYMLLASALGGLWVAGRVVRHWRVDRSALAFVTRERPGSVRTVRDDGPGAARRSAPERERQQGQSRERDAEGRSSGHDTGSSADDDRPPAEHRDQPRRSASDGGERRA